jgi:hypothetical protein
MQEGQAPELVTKWLVTGFLRGVKQHHLQRAAEWLEVAQRRSLGSHDRSALDAELLAMSREGLFGQHK